MTLIAGIKMGDVGCIVGDFRLTNTKTRFQFDVAQKFIFLDDRLALYMAGSIATLGKLKDILKVSMDQITHQNVDADNGILHRKVKECFDQEQADVQSIIIGVHLDVNSKSNKMFRIDALVTGTKRMYKIIPNSLFECEVIGSGEIILDSRRFDNRPLSPLSHIFKRAIDLGYDLITAANAVEQEINSRLEKLGPGIYQTLGITPVMNITIIDGATLHVGGRSVERFKLNQEGLY